MKFNRAGIRGNEKRGSILFPATGEIFRGIKIGIVLIGDRGRTVLRNGPEKKEDNVVSPTTPSKAVMARATNASPDAPLQFPRKQKPRPDIHEPVLGY